MSAYLASSNRWISLGLFAVLSACGGTSPEDATQDVLALSASARQAQWIPLGGDQNPTPSDSGTRISLAGDPRPNPVLAISIPDYVTFTERSKVSLWNSGAWTQLGEPLTGSGPSIGMDSRRRIFACTGGGPYVSRWDGSSWVALGGNISEETGYKGSRYAVYGCGGIVLDSSDTPIVVWSADVGAKANAVYAARWNSDVRKWEGLGEGAIYARATDANIDIDSRDRLYVTTYTPGGSYGGGATTRAWRWNGNRWRQLGADMPATANPVIAVYDNAPYLALHDNATGALQIMRWQHQSWVALPSPGAGDLPALDFTLSGKLVAAYATPDSTTPLQVQYFANGAWSAVGAGLSDAAGDYVGLLDLSIDSQGRPSVGWSQTDSTGSSTSLFVKRYSAALP